MRMAAFLRSFSDHFHLSGPSADEAENRLMSLVTDLSSPPRRCFQSLQRVDGCTGMVCHADDGHMGTDRSRRWQRNYVVLQGEDRFIREMHIWSDKISDEIDNVPSGRCNLVMLHGYGGGSGFFFKNVGMISRQSGWDLYAIDMLGMGCSSRPQFCITASSQQSRTDEAENWFVDALEDWRSARGIHGMVLLGHSFGGYVATCYAIRYPQHVDKVIVASPVAVLDRLSFTIEPKPHFGPPSWLWHLNISPFAVLRAIGPLSRLVVVWWIRTSFPSLLPQEQQALCDYCHAIFCRGGSSEYALPYIIGPGLWARSPLIRRISSCVARTPMTFLTGENDELGVISSDHVKSQVKDGITTKVIRDAGHHVHMDAPEHFNNFVVEELVGKQIGI